MHDLMSLNFTFLYKIYKSCLHECVTFFIINLVLLLECIYMYKYKLSFTMNMDVSCITTQQTLHTVLGIAQVKKQIQN